MCQGLGLPLFYLLYLLFLSFVTRTATTMMMVSIMLSVPQMIANVVPSETVHNQDNISWIYYEMFLSDVDNT